MAAVTEAPDKAQPALASNEKAPVQGQPVEVPSSDSDATYDDSGEDVELHFRTYVAVAAMFLLSFAQLWSLLAPSTLVWRILKKYRQMKDVWLKQHIQITFIGQDLNGEATMTWVVNALVLPQACLGPVFATASDTFQKRKAILVVLTLGGFVGSAIAPGSQSMGRLIGSSVLIGMAIAAAPLSYAIPSEILPRRWRPLSQAGVNGAGWFGALIGPLVLGALLRKDVSGGWRNFYWISMALWGTGVIGIVIGYMPPKRHTDLNHMSFVQKLLSLDLVGCFLITAGLTLLEIGLGLGGGLFAWTNARPISLVIIGVIVIIVFIIYEWKGTFTGILHHALFRGAHGQGRNFAMCMILILIEGMLCFAIIVFYPILTSVLFTIDPLLIAARVTPFLLLTALSPPIWGWISVKLRSVWQCLLAGFIIMTTAIIGLATIEPGDSINSMAFAGLAGLGFGCVVSLVLAGVQLAAPPKFIATASAVIFSSRAVSATISVAIFDAAFRTRLTDYLPKYITKAALAAGLPVKSLPAFITALTNNDTAALDKISDVTPDIIRAGVTALQQANAESIRVVFIIAAPFGVVACVACFFLTDLSKTMNYHIDAPMEATRVRRVEDARSA